MKHRKLRIAWSVAWGIAGVLLLALWVRSYWRIDKVWRTGVVHTTILESNFGDLSLTRFPMQASAVETEWVSGKTGYSASLPSVLHRRFTWLRATNRFLASAPHCFFVTVFGVASTIPWLSLRFSLRTLLIATTLVAVGLGLIVWLR
jgi:hypothetical protein